MFNGIIKHTGKISKIYKNNNNCIIEILSKIKFSKNEIGSSISCSGACLTLEKYKGNLSKFYISKETLNKTNFKSSHKGDLVNLEVALRAGDALGGHLVQGHVDGVAEVLGVEQNAKSGMLEVRLPDKVASVTVSQGSLAIDGVSLTVNSLEGAVARFAVIPYTWSHTTLGGLRAGSRVHVEADIIAKYVGQAMAPYLDPDG